MYNIVLYEKTKHTYIHGLFDEVGTYTEMFIAFNKYIYIYK